MTDQEIVQAALQISGETERSRYLAQVCGTDTGRRRHLSELLLQALAGYEKTCAAPPTARPDLGSAVTQDSEPGGPEVFHESSTVGPGTRIGPYKLIQLLGEGGMGSVWMASQDEPVRRTVAIKCVKPGMDSKRVLARFDIERQALALMDHPNIAKVLDAGTTETGQPYFVMELVKGLPVTKYCDERRLDIRQRLELFIPICHAVQHAHMKGIIHRDIKPSNIMVAQYDGQPVPKVIDFGIAKAVGPKLTEHSVYTEIGSMIGTLEYMAPEQAELNALDVDTRSDIYSLGVLLYELLTGSTPLGRDTLQRMAFAEVIRQIKEVEPPRPSTRVSGSKESLPAISAHRQVEPAKLPEQIRGDLDWIVMKSLAKERDRRYESANGFAVDLLHFLNHEPVTARKPSATYLMSKFIRRRRAAVISAAAMVVLLAGAAIFSTFSAIEARKQRDIAQTERDKAMTADKASRAALQYVGDVFKIVLPKELGGKGKDVTVKTAIDAGESKINERFDKWPLANGLARNVFGTSYFYLGDYKTAIKQLTLAWEIQKQNLGPNSEDALGSQLNLAEAMVNDNRIDDALPLIEDAMRRLRAEYGMDAPLTLKAVNNLANTQRLAKKYQEALATFDELLANPKIKADPTGSLTLSARCNRAIVLRELKRRDDAATELQDVLRIRRTMLEPENHELQNSIFYAAEIQDDRNRPKEAIALFAELLPLREKVFGPNHPLTQETVYAMACARWKLGTARLEAKRTDDVESLLQDAYTGFKSLGGTIDGKKRQNGLTESAKRLAQLYDATGKKDEATKWRSIEADHKKPAQ